MRSSSVCALSCVVILAAATFGTAQLGREVSIAKHLNDGEEFAIPLPDLIEHGRSLFTANWTIQEGGGRPLSKGTGAGLTDPFNPLVFPRNFNRISAPDSNSCAGCHNQPSTGGGGDIVANVFVLGQRFDFLTFNQIGNLTPTVEAIDEAGDFVTLQSVANSRNTLGMFGAGYVEMLARQMTADLQAIADGVGPGGEATLVSKGVSFGTISRDARGNWDTSRVTGLPSPSLAGSPPNLIIRPFHQAAAVISLRQFTNNAFNHHHGIQSSERFGDNTDPDGDGYTNEVTRADVTAATVFQATLPVPGRVIPDDPQVERAVLLGENRFQSIGCTACHIPALPLMNEGWIFTEPNPFNPPGNVISSEYRTFQIDLTSKELPSPRLTAANGVVMVPAFTDLRVHNITSGPSDPNCEELDMHQSGLDLLTKNCEFITRKLWGIANEPPFFHHGQFTTMRQAILAHAGEAAVQSAAFIALSGAEQDAIIEFLKTLQVLPAGTRWLVVNEKGHQKNWPPRSRGQGRR